MRENILHSPTDSLIGLETSSRAPSLIVHPWPVRDGYTNECVCRASHGKEDNHYGKACHLGTTGGQAGQGAGSGEISEVRATACRKRTGDDYLVCHKNGSVELWHF